MATDTPAAPAAPPASPAAPPAPAAAAPAAPPAAAETPKATPPAALPSSVTLASLYAFWQDNADGTRTMRQWVEGQTETNPDNIKLLIERHAPLRDGKE